MSYVLIENGVMTNSQLNVSAYLHEHRLSAPISKYKDLGIYEVKSDVYPDYNIYTQKVVADSPLYDPVKDEVRQGWLLEDMSNDELIEFDDNWTLSNHRISWVMKKYHWDSDIIEPVVSYLKTKHVSGDDSDYPVIATFFDRPSIRWRSFVSVWHVVQGNATLAGVDITLPTIAELRTAWQEADQYVYPY